MFIKKLVFFYAQISNTETDIKEIRQKITYEYEVVFYVEIDSMLLPTLFLHWLPLQYGEYQPWHGNFPIDTEQGQLEFPMTKYFSWYLSNGDISVVFYVK